MSGGGSLWGGDRGGGPAVGQQADGWSAAGSTPQPPFKTGDLSNFGKINKSGPVVAGTSGVWAGKTGGMNRDSTLTEVKSHSDVSMKVGRDAADMHETDSKTSSRRMNTDSGTPEPYHRKPQRRRLQLLPRSKPVKEENETDGGHADHPEDEGGDDVPPLKSKAETNRKDAEDIKEFSSAVRSIEPGRHFTELSSGHQSGQVDKVVSKAIESKEADGRLVADVFATTVEEKVPSISALGEGSTPIARPPGDITIDTPSEDPASYTREDTPATSRFSFRALFPSFS